MVASTVMGPGTCLDETANKPIIKLQRNNELTPYISLFGGEQGSHQSINILSDLEEDTKDHYKKRVQRCSDSDTIKTSRQINKSSSCDMTSQSFMCLEQGIISNINQYAAPKRKQPGRKDPTPSKKTRGAHLNDEYEIGHIPDERTRTMAWVFEHECPHHERHRQVEINQPMSAEEWTCQSMGCDIKVSEYTMNRVMIERFSISGSTKVWI